MHLRHHCCGRSPYNPSLSASIGSHCVVVVQLSWTSNHKKFYCGPLTFLNGVLQASGGYTPSFTLLAAAIGLTRRAGTAFMLSRLAALAAGACCTIAMLHTACSRQIRFYTIQLSSMLCL